MKKINRKLYLKKIGDLTQSEFEELFNIPTDIQDSNFRKILEPIAEYSISDINVDEYKIEEMNFNTAYLMGIISILKEQIPENNLIVLFGESGCGKSHLIYLISKLKQMNLHEITEEDREFFGFNSDECEADKKIREFKEMSDLISVIQKKTTRPSRDGKQNKPEIQEGMSREEVRKCDWTYTIAGNLYGFSKKEIDEALENGDAMIIANDFNIMKQLKQVYPKNFLPVQVYRTSNKEEWIKLMKQGNRASEEIAKRAKKFGFATQIYDDVFENLDYADVIFNLPGKGDTNKDLLAQLKNVRNRKNRSLNKIVDDLEIE